MKPVDILIPNYNGREALQLCIESVATHTPEPHRVIVYDDASENLDDSKYLAVAKARGWIDDIVFGYEHHGHGYGLNELIGICAAGGASYAVIMDNDIQILRRGWLSELLELASNPRVLIVANEKDKFGYCSRGYMPGQFLPWFALLNMTAYRDGMGVDWSLIEVRRTDEPWRTECAHLYPPENNPIFKKTWETWGEYAVDFDPDKVIFDPGCILWCKMRHENPKGYVHRELTPGILASFKHWGHTQNWLNSSNAATPQGIYLRQRINDELRNLREGK